MSRQFVRGYSHARGYIRTTGDTVQLLASQAKQQPDIFTVLKKSDRNSVFDKILSSLMYEQLNAHNRHLVFRPSQGLKKDEFPKVDIDIGSIKESVELSPRKYLGGPSRQDMRVLALTSESSEDVERATNYIEECLKTKAFKKNFDTTLSNVLLIRAAAAGSFGPTLQHLSQSTFRPYLKQHFYTDALRLYALRMPYLSHRSKATLNKFYSRATTGLARELPYAYGLTMYAEKFGKEHQGHLVDTFTAIGEFLERYMERPRRALMVSTIGDLVMGYEAAIKSDLSEAKAVVEPLSRCLEQSARNRPLSLTLSVKLTEVELEALEGAAVETEIEAENKTKPEVESKAEEVESKA